MKSIGRGAKIEGDQVDFTWTLNNGAENFYKPFTNQQQLETYLRAEGISSFTIVWDDDTFEVLSDFLMREQNLRDAGEAFTRAREELSDCSTQLYAAIVEACADGMTEVQAAKVAGVDRMTVRRALGKL